MNARDVLERFFLMDEVRATRFEEAARPRELREAADRARSAVSAAEREGEEAPFAALELYRGAILVLARALSVDDEQLRQAAGQSRDEWAPIGRLLAAPTADLPMTDAELDATARVLRRVALALLARAEEPSGRLRQLLSRRRRRIAMAVLATILAVAGLGRAFARKNLLAGRPWVTSSVYAECQPHLHRCGGASTDIFFHTKEEPSPFVRFDLGRTRTFRGLEVENRLDCCSERAVPLVLEASDDDATWREVARREDRFSRWRAAFPPVSARFVRLRVARSSSLHLQSVALYP